VEVDAVVEVLNEVDDEVVLEVKLVPDVLVLNEVLVVEDVT